MSEDSRSPVGIQPLPELKGPTDPARMPVTFDIHDLGYVMDLIWWFRGRFDSIGAGYINPVHLSLLEKLRDFLLELRKKGDISGF